MDTNFKKEVKSSKENFYTNMIADLRTKNPSQWYSSLKRITGFEKKSEKVIISEINQKSDQEQVEAIADYFLSISNEYEPLNNRVLTALDINSRRESFAVIANLID